MTAVPASCPNTWIDLAHRLADIARPIAKQYFRQPLDIISKADESPVTIADRSIEESMRAEIERTFPDHGIIGEEHGTVRRDAEAVWVLDPIDGTKAFISGMPMFGTLIACCVGSRPVLGIIDQPILEERWFGAQGRGATFNGAPTRVRDTAALGEAMLYSTDPAMFDGQPEEAPYLALRKAAGLARYGGDCYAYGLLASEHVDLVVEAGLQTYDFAAPAAVIKAAGGAVSDFDGADVTLESNGRIVCAGTEALRVEALAILQGK